MYSCAFTREVFGSAGTVHNDTVTVTAVDAGSNPVTASDNAVVEFFTPAAGFGDIGYLVWADLDGDGVVDSGEPGIGGVTLDLISDGGVVQTTTTAADGRYNFRVPNGTYTVDVTDTGGRLGEAQLVSGSDPHPDIVIENTIYVAANFGYALPLAPPAIAVTKTGSTDMLVEEEDVTFHVEVENLSDHEVELIQLYDSVFGNLDGAGSCAVGVTIPAGETYGCEFEQTLSGVYGEVHLDIIVAVVRDALNQPAVGLDDWTIEFLTEPDPIPTLGRGGLALLVMLLLGVGLVYARTGARGA
jgi:hypothetical protein